ncbi:MAG TPA: outer membrane beta-barrel protein [Polyangiaceae bacterium]|nr:outer membrane beta-barrel protein [Polyangiaceae bacterium]
MRLLQVTYRPSSLSVLVGLSLVAVAPAALAQTPGPAHPPVIQPLPPEPTTPPAPPPLSPEPPPPPVTSNPELLPPPPPAPLPAPLPPMEEPRAASHEGLHFSAFVDANYGFQTAKQGSPAPAHRAYEWNNFSTDAATGNSFSNQNGFGLSWAGIDASYDAGQLGATLSLRAGPAVPIFYGGDSGPLGIDNITQAFVNWTPIPQLSIDVGQFSTIFGAEVAESWQNLNYSRGALYYLMQPFWHTGLRATVSPNDKVAITGMVVNGVNSAHDDNESPALALQLSLTPNEMFSLSAGWLTTPQPSTDTGNFDNFFDLVASLTVDRFSLVLNADFDVNADKTNTGPGYTQHLQSPMFWGISLAAAYQATDLFGVALRGEYLSDSDNQLYQVSHNAYDVDFPSTTQTNLVTVTGTLDFKPVRGANNLIIRWDNRIETSNEDLFYNRSEKATNVWFGSILGFVVTTSS